MVDTKLDEPSNGFSAKLIAEDGTQYELSGEMKVGRVEDCDITIDDPRISRAHALINVRGTMVTIKDLGSANGSRINKRRAQGDAEIKDGDTVSFENHHFKVAISSPQFAADMTVVNMQAVSDETIVGSMAVPTIEPAPEPVPAALEPAREPARSAPAAEAFNLPGSWVEDEDEGEHTRIVRPEVAAEAAAAIAAMDGGAGKRQSDQVHLQVIEDGVAKALFELEISDGQNPDVWEIGRGESCEIVLSAPSVSTRHAQLIHQNGRWRLVNLVSANGIFVNEEKRLTAYLADGDKIRLGMASLVFRTAAGATAARPRSSASQTPTGGKSGGMLKTLLIAGAVIVVVAGLALLASKML